MNSDQFSLCGKRHLRITSDAVRCYIYRANFFMTTYSHSQYVNTKGDEVVYTKFQGTNCKKTWRLPGLLSNG